MNLQLLKTLCKMTVNDLIKILSKYLINRNYKVISTSDYIIAEGREPITLIAHLDTVSIDPPDDIFYDQEQSMMWSPQLLGADDRAGVYAIIQIIEKGYKPHIIFTTGEEVGGVGALTLIKNYPKCPFKENKAIIELDRCGINDCVFYQCNNRNFVDYIEKFGFKEAYGTFTDISIIAPEWEVAATNLSVGYVNEHSALEHLNTKVLDKTIEKVENIILEVAEMPYFKYIPVKKSKYFRWGGKECLCCGSKIGQKNKRITPEGYCICDNCYSLYYS